MSVIAPNLRFSGFSQRWQKKTLGDFMTFKNGVNADKSMYGSGRKFINVLDVIAPAPITHDRIIGSVTVSDKEFAKNEVQYGDILFQRSSETRVEVGQSNVYLDKDKTATFGGFVIRGHATTEFDPMFFHALLKTDKVRDDMTSRSGGSTRYNIGQDSLASVPVHVPSLPEQQKIAAFLGAVDARLAALAARQAALGRFKAGLMQKLFSQQLRFTREDGGAFPDWQEKRLGDFCNVLSGHPVSGEDILEIETDFRLLRGANISEGSIRHSKELDRFFGGFNSRLARFILKVGDVVIGMDGSKVGKNVATIDQQDAGSFLIQRVTRLRTDQKNDLRYVYHHVTSPRFRQYVDVVNTSSGIPHISLKQIRDFEIPMPHPDEQQKIASALSAMDAKIQAVAEQVTKLQTFKKGLLQQMFV
ncbi:restriction endonuclease subunit S [Roseovarius autotrophicus]|uniref:restriction endonuclease subunit S n=1 Tax=Roseovarius autotrophicus TaxID=2824121 RepID=UPI001B37BDAA|nr:restriction endonuclease subunit S [Roseovarius autotrophicus]